MHKLMINAKTRPHNDTSNETSITESFGFYHKRNLVKDINNTININNSSLLKRAVNEQQVVNDSSLNDLSRQAGTFMNASQTNGTKEPSIPLEKGHSMHISMLKMYQNPTKNMDTVKKLNSYRKKFVLHEPESDKDEISFDLKSIISEEEE